MSLHDHSVDRACKGLPKEGQQAADPAVDTGRHHATGTPVGGPPQHSTTARTAASLPARPERVPRGPARSTSTATSSAGIRVVALSICLTFASVALLVWGPLRGLGPVRAVMPELAVAAALAVLSAAAILAPISFHHRGNTYQFNLGEVPLLLGLAFASPAALLAGRAVGQAVGLGVVRRQGPVKLAFNLATGVFTAALADTLYREIIGKHPAVGPVGWTAGAVALAVSALTSQVAVALVVRISGQRRQHSARFDFVTFGLLLVASIGLAFVVLDSAWTDPWAVLPLAVVGGLIVFAYRGYLRLSQRFGALEQLYDFGRTLGGPQVETGETTWEVLERVQSVMRASRAEVILSDDWPYGQHAALRDDRRSATDGVLLETSPLIAGVMVEGRASLQVRPSDQRTMPTHDLVLGEFREALVAPLANGERVFGALLALDRQEAFDPFDEDDLRLFEALAAHAGTTLERARLVEELRLEAESKSHQALHDTLTGLPNRALFLERASAALAETGRAAVALLDLDRFKEVNDTLGHATGDKLLCEVAECLVRAAHGRATVARLGGDEFAVVVTDIIGPEEAIGIVRDLEAALMRPMSVEGITLAVRASAGVALAPEHGDNVATLLQRADIAMYLAKSKRTGIELYSPSQDQNMQRKLVLGGQLAQALGQHRGLHVAYQPIARLSTGEILRVEALARWDHPDLGQVPADEFIGVAAQMGLIGEITDFVLAEACAQAGRWRDSGMAIGVSVNLSGRDLTEDSIVAKVAARLAENRLEPGSLTLEVTETEVMADIGEASTVLSKLAQLGTRVAVDDYGTGYSSLAYLHRLPLTELKIDRSFITDMATDQSNAIIVRSSITMAHSLGLAVVAEGAEDELTCAVLADCGCDSVQGYYLSRPVTAEVLTAWLATKPRLHFSRDLPPPLRVISGQSRSPRSGREGLGRLGG
ncbi:MAG: EAL domain-containing protein [Actinomycetota bacterium]|nr:EAL domain-containing protein [Actinomycetota bacterium]